jgi:hypothetical protein
VTHPRRTVNLQELDPARSRGVSSFEWISRRKATAGSGEAPHEWNEDDSTTGHAERAILIVGGRAIAGEAGLTYGLILAVGMNFFSYFFSEKIALMSAQAQPVSQTQHPEIYARLNPRRRRSEPANGYPHTKAVGDAGTFAESVCHGAQPKSRVGGVDRGYPATDG